MEPNDSIREMHIYSLHLLVKEKQITNEKMVGKILRSLPKA